MNASPLLPMVTRVREFRQESHDVFTLTLDPPANSTSTFRPGQFNMLYAFGIGEAAISISGDPHDGSSIVHTIRAVGSVTNALARLRPGDAVGVRGPFGSAWPLDAARGHDVVIVTGGIGLAPLRPVLYHLFHNRSQYGRIVLLQGVRGPQDVLFAEESERWAKNDSCQMLLAADQGDATWRGHVGVVTSLFPLAQFDATKAIGLMCGPEVMMRYALREFEKRGVAQNRVYVSLERNMQCAVGFCGHCQYGPNFVCMDGPVFRFDRIRHLFDVREA